MFVVNRYFQTPSQSDIRDTTTIRARWMIDLTMLDVTVLVDLDLT
jgi:hypothetical protein